MIQLENVSKSFDGGNTYAVDSVSLDIQQGETIVLLGTSGCGKTTTLKMINRLIEPTDGIIRVDDQDTREMEAVELRRKIGYVFQGIGLFPHMNIEENISIVLRLIGEDKKKRRNRARELMEMVELEPDDFSHRYPHELSGGQMQRIGVARALAADPDYLLMDEPFGALDALTRDTMQQEIIRLKDQLNKTIIFVTHDMFEAVMIADRIAVMNAGRIDQVGTKNEILNSPATDFVKDLFEKPTRQLELLKVEE